MAEKEKTYLINTTIDIHTHILYNIGEMSGISSKHCNYGTYSSRNIYDV